VRERLHVVGEDVDDEVDVVVVEAGIPEREEVRGVVVLRRGMIGGGNVGWYYTYLDGGLEVERAGLGVYIEGVTKDRGFMINS